jgi:cytoskeletal protein RodZ
MMPYIAHVGLILAGCLIFYKLLLQKETFFRTNRWLLLVCLALSFGLPLIQVPQQWSFQKAEVVATAEVSIPTSYNEYGDVQPPAATPVVTTSSPTTSSPAITWRQVLTWAGWLYWFGVIVFGMNLLLQLITLLYRAYASPVIQDGRFLIVELNGDQAPCSFLNSIFLNPAKYDWDTYNQILLHEKVHVQQRHSLDLLIAELVIVFQWFNPFAWQYRKALEDNLEYLTDDQLLHNPQVEKDSYQLSLLKVSAPQFPLHLTTNYNQSLLKKRIAMMNVKKSNVHTAWKYGFLLPVLVLLVCLLNKPAAVAQEPVAQKKENKERRGGLDTEGAWFATIKGNEVSIQFRGEDNEHSTNSNSFALSDLGTLPKDKSGVFTVTREAGTVEFTGRFEGDQGMGRYKFTADKAFGEDMRKEGIELRDDRDQLVFFFVNASRSFVKMIKDNGYTNLTRNNVIPLAALKVDGPWIQSIKKSGIGEVSLQNLIPFKALHIDGDYISEIRKAGYPNITAGQLISFKSQNIDAKYIADVRAAAGTLPKPSALKENKSSTDDNDNRNDNRNVNVNVDTKVRADVKADAKATVKADAKANVEVSINDIISIKALNITPEYIKSLKEAGYSDLSNGKLISMKSQDITADYIKGLQAAGFKDLSANDLISFKAQEITPEYARSLRDAGFPDLSNHHLISMKAQGITAAYIKELKTTFKDLSPNDVVSFKAQGITKEFVQSFEALGYKDIRVNQIISLKALGVTPEYIKGFKDIGFTDISPNNAVSMKSQGITPAIVNEYKKLGFDDISLNQVVSARATGTTPAFIASMKEKGHDLKSLNKYIQLKTIVN